VAPSAPAPPSSATTPLPGDVAAGAQAMPVEPTADRIEFGLSHPWGVARGVPFPVEAWVFRPSERRDAEQRATARAPAAADAHASGAAVPAQGIELTIKLEIAPWEAQPKERALVFAGALASVSFTVTPAVDVLGGRLSGALSFHARGMRIAQLPVQLSLGSAPLEQKRFLAAPPMRTAFASYAGRDRARVRSRVEGLEKFGVNVLVDARDHKSDDPYPTHLLEKIETCDLLFLFWSRHAQRSKWVEREWQHALVKKGLAFIEVVPLADPRKVAPPKPLADDKHLEDWTLAFLEYEKSLTPWGRLLVRLFSIW
jgi:hypothetical protein